MTTNSKDVENVTGGVQVNMKWIVGSNSAISQAEAVDVREGETAVQFISRMNAAKGSRWENLHVMYKGHFIDDQAILLDSIRAIDAQHNDASMSTIEIYQR